MTKRTDGELFDVGAPVKTEVAEEREFETKVVAPDRTVPLPFEPITGAEFSEDRVYRYSLWRKVRPTGKTVLFVCLNPSTADEIRDDHTVARLIGFGMRWGFAKIVVANLFAFRATDPRQMKRRSDPVGPDNNWWLTRLLGESDLCVLAWGNHGLYRRRAAEVCELLRDHAVGMMLSHSKKVPIQCFGRTKRGEPRHPLYLRGDTDPVEFLHL